MKRLILISLLLLAVAGFGAVLLANSAGGYTLSWSTLDGGGGTSQGGSYRAAFTIGQADTGVMAGGGYTLRGGFWAFGLYERLLYLPVISKP